MTDKGQHTYNERRGDPIRLSGPEARPGQHPLGAATPAGPPFALSGITRWALPRGLRGPAALLLAFLLLVGSALALNFLLASLSESRALVLRTDAILRDAAELLAEVRAAETGQRGYILTGERRYLSPHEQALRQVWVELDQLDALVRVPEQVSRLRALRPLIQTKLDELART